MKQHVKQMRHQQIEPKLTAVVISRLYDEPRSLKETVQRLVEGAPVASDIAEGLIRSTDTPTYKDHLLKLTVVCISKRAPPLQLQQLRLSQRYTQEQVQNVKACPPSCNNLGEGEVSFLPSCSALYPLCLIWPCRCFFKLLMSWSSQIRTMC